MKFRLSQIDFDTLSDKKKAWFNKSMFIFVVSYFYLMEYFKANFQYFCLAKPTKILVDSMGIVHKLDHLNQVVRRHKIVIFEKLRVPLLEIIF